MDLSWVAGVVGVPWVLRGRSAVTGWDCLGCAEVCQARALGTPEINSLALYAGDTRRSPAGLLTAHFAAGLALYREAPRKTPGAILIFRLGRRPVHCGLYLGQGRFLHASEKAGTVISELDDPDYGACAAEYYLPAELAA